MLIRNIYGVLDRVDKTDKMDFWTLITSFITLLSLPHIPAAAADRPSFPIGSRHSTVRTPKPPITDCTPAQTQMLGTKVLQEILKHYDNNLVPSPHGVDVEVELIIQSISEISEISYSFKSDLLFSQIWHDPGLRFDHITTCLINLTLSHRMIEKLWLPNVCFVNSKKTEIHASPTPNIFLLIFPNGTVWTNYRVVVQAPCKMNFTVFPMDVVHCELIFESYSFNAGKVSKFSFLTFRRGAQIANRCFERDFWGSCGLCHAALENCSWTAVFDWNFPLVENFRYWHFLSGRALAGTGAKLSCKPSSLICTAYCMLTLTPLFCECLHRIFCILANLYGTLRGYLEAKDTKSIF